MGFLRGTQADHRLDSKRMAWFEEMGCFVLGIVWHAWCRVKELIDAVSAVRPVDGTVVVCRDFFDDCSEISVQSAWFRYRYRSIKTRSRSADESSDGEGCEYGLP